MSKDIARCNIITHDNALILLYFTRMPVAALLDIPNKDNSYTTAFFKG